MNTRPAAHTAATSSWFQKNWSRQTNCEDSNIQSLNTPLYGMGNSVPRPEHQSVSPIPWNLDVERFNGQESQWNFRTPSRGDTNRLTCDNQPLSSPCGPTVSEWSQSSTNNPHVTLHSYVKPTIPDSYYSESFGSSTYRSNRPGFSSEYNRQTAGPSHKEMFKNGRRGNVQFLLQNVLFDSSPVRSEKASLGTRTRDFMDTDLGVTGDFSAVSQTMSRHDDEASLIPEGSQDTATVVFPKYIEIESIINSEYPKLEPDATVTHPLEQDNFDSSGHEILVKENVSSPRVRFTSSTRRKVEARFACHIKGCGGTFTRKKNLEYHLNSHRGIRNHICPCRKGFNTKAGLKRHQGRSCMLGRQLEHK